MIDLVQIHLIQQLKYRYFRAVDTHDWELLSGCLTEDCTARYDQGKYSFDGRDMIISGLKAVMDSPHKLTMHQGHHPEISLLDEQNATGIWYLQDYVVDAKEGWFLFGTAIYEDRYRKVNGEWLLCHTGYSRIFEQVATSIPEWLKLTQNRFIPNPKS